jgi:hypothetical protein
MNRAAIYARLSLADENSTSTERQRKDCRDHAKSLGLEVVAGHPARLHNGIPPSPGNSDYTAFRHLHTTKW